MQTFLAYTDCTLSAKCLDSKRLGKQRVEAVQIANCLLIKESRWRNHPAVKMWKGYEKYLVITYLFNIMKEWQNRGYKNIKCMEHYKRLNKRVKKLKYRIPKWLNENFCITHRSNLIRKKPEYYKKFFPKVKNNLSYLWPVK